ncbi:MAG: hypothetical protein ABIJ08_05395 [Nanoarchaeota archaeon]
MGRGKLAKIKKLLNNIKECNSILGLKINKCLSLELTEEKLIRELLESYSRLKKTKYQLEYDELILNIKTQLHIFKDNCRIFQHIIDQQKRYLKNHSEDLGRVVSDLRKHTTLFILFKDELDVEKNIGRTLVNIIDNVKSLDKKKGPETKGPYYIHEIFPPADTWLFKRMYNECYVSLFPDPDEREEFDTFVSYVNRRYKFHKHNAISHILVLMCGNQPVGGFIFDFVGCNSDISFAICWFMFAFKEHRLKGFSILLDYMVGIIYRDAQMTGYKDLVGLIVEVNNPAKMTSEQIANDSVDPRLRLRLWRVKGCRELVFNYIQPILPPATEPVTYLSLLMYPMEVKWKNEGRVPADTMIEILYRFVEFGFEKNPKKDPFYRMMEKELSKKDYVELR